MICYYNKSRATFASLTYSLNSNNVSESYPVCDKLQK